MEQAVAAEPCAQHARVVAIGALRGQVRAFLSCLEAACSINIHSDDEMSQLHSSSRLGGRNTTLQTVAAEPCVQHARVVHHTWLEAIGALRAGVGRCVSFGKSNSLQIKQAVTGEPCAQHARVVAIGALRAGVGRYELAWH